MPSAVFAKDVSAGLLPGRGLLGGMVLAMAVAGRAGKCWKGSRAMEFSRNRAAIRSTSCRSSSRLCLWPLDTSSEVRLCSLTSLSCFSARVFHCEASTASRLFKACSMPFRSVISASSFASILWKRAAFSLSAWSTKASSCSKREILAALSSSIMASISEWCCSSVPFSSFSCAASVRVSPARAFRSSASSSRTSCISSRRPFSRKKVASSGFSWGLTALLAMADSGQTLGVGRG
mmetsp:Transcript_18406/g.57943  ORF Transcript_18406/g.57943 Transcript_18406/m.57943 type:complete len:235 (-) Transcript_18406:19-723(-)